MPSMLILVPSHVPQCVEIFNGMNTFNFFHGTLHSGAECLLAYSCTQALLLLSEKILFIDRSSLVTSS